MLNNTQDPKLIAHTEKCKARDHWSEHIFRRVLHILERCIAVITLIVLLFSLGYEVYNAITIPNYLSDSSTIRVITNAPLKDVQNSAENML